MISADNIRFRSLSIGKLRIQPGVTSIIGPNGSGKTTLLKMLAGITIPESGTILIDGIPPRDTEIGWVNEFPDRNILFASVFEEIASPLRFRMVPCSAIPGRVESCMESLGITALAQRPVKNLSGGEKVMVALAAALVIGPRVLVLDEYDSHLDMNRAGEISRIIRKSEVPYVIHCTQDTEAAARSDYVLFLKEGSICSAGTPREVFSTLDNTAYYPLSWTCRA